MAYKIIHSFIYLFILVVVALGFEGKQVEHLLGRCSTTLSHSTSLVFMLGFSKIGSHQLWAGFEP
jgi:hypothetical protein